jgi:prepilin signal peptidase PulO-like enzyme (type II secretory pathway)
VTLGLIALLVIGFLLAAVLWNLSEIGLGKSARGLHPVCGHCKTPLPATTWLPLAGFFTAWRCRSCNTTQPRLRLIWEVAVAVYFLALGWQWDDSRQLVFAAISAVPLLLILIIDLRGNVLYLNSIVLALVVAAVLGFVDGPRAMGSAMVGLIGGVAITVAFFALSRWVFRSMNFKVSAVGVGDIYIAAAVGAIVRGDGIVPAFVIAVILAVLASVLLPLVSKSARGHATAYGPFLCLGGLITLLL